VIIIVIASPRPLQPGFRLYCIVLHYHFAASLYKHRTRPTVTDVPWSVCVCLCVSVCLLVTTVSPTKTDEPIEMPFRVLTPVGLRNQVLGWTRVPPGGATFFWGGGRMFRPIEKYRECPT